jgi:hypothetical protein
MTTANQLHQMTEKVILEIQKNMLIREIEHNMYIKTQNKILEKINKQRNIINLKGEYDARVEVESTRMQQDYQELKKLLKEAKIVRGEYYYLSITKKNYQRLNRAIKIVKAELIRRMNEYEEQISEEEYNDDKFRERLRYLRILAENEYEDKLLLEDYKERERIGDYVSYFKYLRLREKYGEMIAFFICKGL